MPRLTANQLAWIVILSVALALRLAGGFWWQSRLAAGQKFYFGDSDSYWVLGHTIARGDPYQYESPDRRVFRSPGYPLLLAGLFRIVGDDKPMAARALNAVLGVVAVGLVGWWATWLFDAQAGRIAGWIAALYPGTVAMGAFVLSEGPFCVFMLLQLALWGLASRAASNSRAIALAIAAGVAGAAATLIRPSWLLFLPFALVVAWVIERGRARQTAIGLAMGASLIVGMLPWWVRNAQVTGHFVATTLQTGASLYDGLNPAADGSSNMEFVATFTVEERAVEPEPTPGIFEYRLDRRMRASAVTWARENPLRVAQLAVIKLMRTWNVWPNEPSLQSWPLRLVVFATYTPLVCLSILGIWRFTSWGWPYALAWLPAVYLSLLHMVFVGSIRYREPAMLALTVLAAGVLAGCAPQRSGVDRDSSSAIPSPLQPG